MRGHADGDAGYLAVTLGAACVGALGRTRCPVGRCAPRSAGWYYGVTAVADCSFGNACMFGAGFFVLDRHACGMHGPCLADAPRAVGGDDVASVADAGLGHDWLCLPAADSGSTDATHGCGTGDPRLSVGVWKSMAAFDVTGCGHSLPASPWCGGGNAKYRLDSGTHPAGASG